MKANQNTLVGSPHNTTGKLDSGEGLSRSPNITNGQAKVIVKHCNYLRQAEAYQQRLYNKHNSVQLVNFPRFSNAGCYTWKVS